MQRERENRLAVENHTPTEGVPQYEVGTHIEIDYGGKHYSGEISYIGDIDVTVFPDGGYAWEAQVMNKEIFEENLRKDRRNSHLFLQEEQPIETEDRLKVKLGSEYSEVDDMVIVPEEEGYINVAWFIYEFIALSIPMKHVHAPGKCNKDMVNKLSKHLRVSGDEEEDDDDFLVEPTDEPQEIDPRWNELKKILDNN